jgi:hypothetical protein
MSVAIDEEDVTDEDKTGDDTEFGERCAESKGIIRGDPNILRSDEPGRLL